MGRAYRAVATWWADRLPGRCNAPSSMSEDYQGLTVTDEQYSRFIDTFFEILRAEPVRAGALNMGCLITSWHRSESLVKALNAVGLPADLKNPMSAGALTLLQHDGKIFIGSRPLGATDYTHEVLDYEGCDAPPWFPASEINFEGSSHYRTERRFFIVDLAVGQTVYRVFRGECEPVTITEEGQALRVQFSDLTDRTAFESLTIEGVLDPRQDPNIQDSDIIDAADYKEGAAADGEFTQKVGDNFYWKFGPVFQARKATESYAISIGTTYQVLQPGDFLTREIGKQAVGVVCKEQLERRSHVWCTCQPNGELLLSPESPHPALQ